MTDDRKDTDAARLDACFAALRAQRITPTDAFTGRLIADAAALQPPPAGLRAATGIAGARARAGGLRGWVAGVVSGLGGGPAVAGIVSTGIFGVALGVAGFGPVATLGDALLGTPVVIDLGFSLDGAEDAFYALLED